MCFSANASFGASVVLSVIGVVTLMKVQTKAQILFASIPLLFAVQQLSEGFLWLSLQDIRYESMKELSMYTFLFFAQILWPIWVPISIILLEKEVKRKRIQRIFVGLGVIVSLYLAYSLFFYNTDAKILGYHIAYKISHPVPIINSIGSVFYVVVTVLPQFFSHIRKMWTLGTTILISYFVTVFFYEHYIVSVWCFFSSFISIYVFVIMLEIKNNFSRFPQNENYNT